MKKTFREEHWLGSKEQFTEHLVRFYWDLADGAEVPHWIDFEIYPVIAYTMEDVREFHASESQELVDGLTADVARAHPPCNGFVKWDGCTQIYFAADRNHPALHFDDADGMRTFFEVLTFARARALVVMPEDDK